MHTTNNSDEQDKVFEDTLSSFKKSYRIWMPIFFSLVIFTNIFSLLMSILSKYVKQLPLGARITLYVLQGLLVTVLLIATCIMLTKVIQFRRQLKQFQKDGHK